VTIVAHAYQFVVGVDTHARTHALSILVAATGAVVDESQFPATDAGMARAIAWVERRTDGDMATLWVIEASAPTGHASPRRLLSRDINLSRQHGWTLGETAALANQTLWTLVALLQQPSRSSSIVCAIPVRIRASALHFEC
jgi:hypothetical protein